MPVRNNPSRSLGSRESTLLKDTRYSKFILRKDATNLQTTESKELRMVLGLDYGTSFTAVAFALDSETFQNIRLITDWPGRRSGSEKVPSQIAYGSFPESQETWGTWGFNIPPSVARHTWTKRLLDADRIPQLQLTSDWNQLKLEEGRSPYPTKKPKCIVQDYLSAVKDHVFCCLKWVIPEIALNSLVLDVVITVPALWSDKAKELVFQAVKSSGFPQCGGKIMMVTEPEAAATYIIRATESEFGGNFFKV